MATTKSTPANTMIFKFLLLLLCSGMQFLITSGQVPLQLKFQGVSYPNNSVLSLNDIGDISTGSAIFCTTNRSPCCSHPVRVGQWYYPDGSMVPNNVAGKDFYRGRGDDQTIHLSRRNNTQTPTGSFCCELPDNSDVNHTLCVHLVPISITPSGINTAAFRVIVGTTVDITSTQVSIKAPVAMTTIQQSTTTTIQQSTTTTRPDKSASTDGAAAASGTNTAAIVAGLVVAVLVVVILPVMVAVIMMVCTAYGPAKSTELGSEYEDMKTGNEVYEEIPDKPPAENFDLATNVAYGPIQHSDTTTTSDNTYDEITHAAPAASLHPNAGEREYEAP